MRKDRYVKRHFHKKSLTLVLAVALSCVLLVCGVVGGTLAWLTDKTENVTNTFTTSDINIKLTETTKDYKMIPGWTIEKDPIVTVAAGSEDCYVFIKVEESKNLKEYIAYNIEPDWKEVPGVENVYYVVCPDITVDRSIKILAPGSFKDTNDVTYEWSNNQVLTLPTVTKEMMNAIDGVVEKTDNMSNDDYNSAVENEKAAQPTLTFTAYAVQLYKNSAEQFTAADAWAKANPSGN